MCVGRNLHDKRFSPLVQSIEKRSVTAVQLVGRPGHHFDPVGSCTVDQVQRDLRLCLEDDLVGNVVFFTAHRIVGPFLGQVQPSVQQAIESRCGIGQGNGVDAVFDLAAIAVVLPFDASGVATSVRPTRSIPGIAAMFWTRRFDPARWLPHSFVARRIASPARKHAARLGPEAARNSKRILPETGRAICRVLRYH